MSDLCKISVIEYNDLISYVCLKCCQLNQRSCNTETLNLFCEFMYKEIIKDDNIANVYICKNCHFLAPNPVVTLCTKTKLYPNCVCTDSTSSTLCDKHELVVSKVNKRCNFIQTFLESTCVNCNLSTVPRVGNFIKPVCRKKSEFYTGTDYYTSNTIIHRFSKPFG